MHIKPCRTSKNKEVFELVHLKMKVTKKLMRNSNSKYNCLISSFSLHNIETKKKKKREKKKKGKKKRRKKKSRKLYNVQESFIVYKKVL